MEQNESPNPKIKLKAYSKTEVAKMYGVSTKSLKTWLAPFEKELGKKVGRFYNPKQIAIIFEKLGRPE